MEFIYDHPLHLFLLAGPDYSQALVEATNPELWALAQGTGAPRAAVHGFRTLGDLMTAMNPLTGTLYAEALHMTRVAREAYVVIGGKYPHPETVIPGGVTTTVSVTTFNEFYSRLHQFFDYSKRVVAIWDDLTDFFYAANPLYRQVGARPATMIDLGIWDHPDAYDATYKNCNAWGSRRWATPGALVDGQLVTTDLQALNVGLEEFVEHSYYEGWSGQRFQTDPLGAPLSPYHMWNKETRPKPGKQDWKERYTWDTSPRWDRTPMEAGAYARIYNTALAQKMPASQFMEATGHSLRLRLPAAAMPEMEMEWTVPPEWNTLERNRARAYCLAYTALVTMDNWLLGLKLLRDGQAQVHTPFEIPKRGTHIGVGFWGAGRGYLSHHAVIEDGTLSNYQIVTPSTWNASPRDPFGVPGPYEAAVLNTPILETFNSPEDYKGIDILRTLRSFDPCMPCTTHIHLDGADRMITREVTTCACGLDD
jgi:hydrogenase large subunit